MLYNKIIELEDYQELSPSQPLNCRKWWEVLMSMRTLRDFGALGPGAEILGVGAGHEPTIYLASGSVRRVFAADMYLASGSWTAEAPPDMLIDPSRFDSASYGSDLQRIVPVHMDARRLRFPNDTFDGVFSSGSIEHFGDFGDIARAASEIGRVLKPGAILSLSTEYRIAGDSDGWPGCVLFSPETLRQYVIEPSGLTLVDNRSLVFGVPDRRMMGTCAPLSELLDGRWPPVEAVLEHRGCVFTSVHLAMRKPLV